MANEFARNLRKNLTDTERFIWSKLRHRQMSGWRFRRQAPIGPYIADFVCFECKLIIELDGSQHAEQLEADAERTQWLESQGYRVLRFWNHEVFEDWDNVSDRIWAMLRRDP